MQDSLTLALQLIPVAAALVGALVALDQLSMWSRMRRIADWARQLADQEDGNRRDALLRLHSDSAGKAVAHSIVPSTKFFLPVATVIYSWVLFYFSWEDSWNTVITILIAAFVALMNTNHIVFCLMERFRIYILYRNGREVERHRVSFTASMYSNNGFDWLLSLLITLGAVTSSFMLWMVVANQGGPVVARVVLFLVLCALGVVSIMVFTRMVQPSRVIGRKPSPSP